jgi:hypothetical protein
MANYQQLDGTAGAPLVAKDDYTAYVEYVENVLGGRREQITLDENYTKIVALTPVAATQSLPFIDIRCPAGQKYSIMGTQQIPRGADARTAHSLRMRLASDASGNVEISWMNKIRITKEGITDSITNIARVSYMDVNYTKNPGTLVATSTQSKTDLEWYRFKQGIEMNGEQHLIFSTVNLFAGDAILAATTRFGLDIDIWYF